MGHEIEKKFLVKGEYKTHSFQKSYLKQGYLSSTPERTVRIRISNQKGFITIKGKRSESSIARYEWEKEISLDEAKELMMLCEPGIIEKTRYLIKNGSHIFEVDEFHGDNTGLVVAEIELTYEEEPFEKPDWLSKEVTGDKNYYNSMLSKHPYVQWAPNQ